ncbi:MAG: 8-amino-7-oxononanoate synthase [Pirellulaceae bacterium]
MTPRLDWLDDEVAALQRGQLYRPLRTRESVQGAIVDLDGRSLVNFGSNDYLGLAVECGKAVDVAVAPRGGGSAASPAIHGRGACHDRLERLIAEFEQCERALLFPTGYATNVGVIPSITGHGDVIFSDTLNHASLIDGCRLSAAKVLIYRHGDVDHLTELLRASRTYRRRLIVTESLFSMDGDFAPLVEICELAERFDAMTMIDEAHGSGVWGQHGRGVAELLGIEQSIDIRVGTLSKAFGAGGGFVCGSETLVTWMRHRARSYFFSTAMPEPVVEMAIFGMKAAIAEPWRRETVIAHSQLARQQLQLLGWDTGLSTSQIVPVHIGASERAMEWMNRLAAANIFVPAIRPPSVPDGRALLRLSFSAAHTPEMIQQLLESFRV